jgi:hypothetical protein
LTAGLRAGDASRRSLEWDEIDEKMELLRRRLDTAVGPDDFSAVGLQCISVMRTVADRVFDSNRDLSPGEEMPGRDDVKARIGLFLSRVAPGRRGENMRTLVKTACAQANAVKHHRSASTLEAGFAADLAALVVSTLRALDEARDA